MRTCPFVLAVLLVYYGAVVPGFGQSYFYGEDKFRNQVLLTPELIEGLKKDKEFAWCYNLGTINFEATSLDLNRDGVREVLVKGNCGNSAYSFYYWIVKRKKASYTPIFFVGTMGLTFSRRRTNGYSEITSGGCSAAACTFVRFSFKGRRYMEKREWTRPNL